MSRAVTCRHVPSRPHCDRKLKNNRRTDRITPKLEVGVEEVFKNVSSDSEDDCIV
jgi:hypothetical protein